MSFSRDTVPLVDAWYRYHSRNHTETRTQLGHITLWRRTRSILAPLFIAGLYDRPPVRQDGCEFRSHDAVFFRNLSDAWYIEVVSDAVR
jgi:hypothetical protein